MDTSQYTPKIERICPQCGIQFQPLQRQTQKYCSRICRDNARKNQVECICEFCGLSFQTKSSQIERGRGKYCSIACRDAAKRNQVNCICEQCGKPFQIDPAQIKHGVGKYCSRECHSIGQRKQIDCVCLQCGIAFQVTLAVVKRGGGKYCSKTCMGLSKRGENHPFWRGGQSKYRGPNWTQQRKLAYNRDNGECKYCGKKPKIGERKFQVHHIKPFREFNGDYLSANRLTNLITLCQLCHRKAEHGKIIIQPYLF